MEDESPQDPTPAADLPPERLRLQPRPFRLRSAPVAPHFDVYGRDENADGYEVPAEIVRVFGRTKAWIYTTSCCFLLSALLAWTDIRRGDMVVILISACLVFLGLRMIWLRYHLANLEKNPSGIWLTRAMRSQRGLWVWMGILVLLALVLVGFYALMLFTSGWH